MVHCTAQVPLPPTAVLGSGKPQGKAHIPDPLHRGSTSNTLADAYSCMTFKPLTGSEEQRWQQSWNDGAHQPRKKGVAAASAAAAAAAARGPGLQQLIAAQPALPVRRVPCAGGIAQEVGMSLDTIVANRRLCFEKGGSSSGSGGGSNAGGFSGSGKRSSGGTNAGRTKKGASNSGHGAGRK